MIDRKLLERLKQVDTEELLELSLYDFFRELGPKRLGLFHDERSFKLFVLDYMVRAFNDNVEWPIHYQAENETAESAPAELEEFDFGSLEATLTNNES